ncbi:iron ABC transporter permease [Luteimicrobium xylanilyticum]|uniref:Putative siderophore transport system permease protein YfiZ n=1 Tax=Luteimicrobium xylanilyticum TaxID=1133546 RepID=A0A5P9QCL7_9MICO|nr:iron ABC transporter permease [Luteimicrobium xylanilyticum]QFU99208.1 putative siderophore transport system permease protein YfiZ [Luteimicrobium xylanilyticum]
MPGHVPAARASAPGALARPARVAAGAGVPAANAPTDRGNAAEPVSTGPRRPPAAALLIGVAVLVVVVCVVALSLGPVRIPFTETCRVLLGSLGLHHLDVSASDTLVVRDIRLPRVLLALLAGAGLAVAGCSMQAFFRNPLADPGVTGVSSGAAVGAVVVLATGVDALGTWTLPAAAFLGALAAMAAVQVVGLLARDRSPVTLLLVGIALNAFLGAVIGAIISNAADSQTVRSAVFWLQGDLGSADWSDVRSVVAPVLVCTSFVLLGARELNALLLGDDQARSVGMDVSRVRTVLLVVTAILVGSIVAVTGVIGFVGLVVPHVVRAVVGADHRLLLPLSALVGAGFLVLADTVARVVIEPVAWQTGVVTALVGSPVFLVLVLRIRRAGAGA